MRQIYQKKFEENASWGSFHEKVAIGGDKIFFFDKK